MVRVLYALLLGLALTTPAPADDLHVAVAANFLATAQTLAERFEAETGHRVLLSSGSTGKLYAQILQGGPYQVFLAADRERPRLLEQSGAAIPGSRVTYAVGRLVLWSRDPERLKDGVESLRSGAIRRLAIANPRTAPYGAAAQQTLHTLGLWDDWRHRTARGENVSQALQYAATGNVDAAFISYAQIQSSDGRLGGGAWLVPAHLYHPIAQQAVLLRTAEGRPAARAFLLFLQSAEAQRLIAAAGYGLDSAR